ncbi:E3 ubiquitin-protein ligase RNF220-like [Artemia franciscana]|uniref:RING-type domain-containing protein n=1 Tax=Artemia franciscana TaxID=6661 RepID=A0AA88I1A0_ARTSF|nr:hypothetical protein QYM36_003406 [Artemia franciscana]
MDNSPSFIPTSLPPHSLALLSQTNSLADALRIPRVFQSTQVGDGKEMQHHPYPFSVRQDYPGIMSPVSHTFFPHFLDPRIQLNSAFRPLTNGEDSMKMFPHFAIPSGTAMKKPEFFSSRFAGQFPFFGATQLPPGMSPREMPSPQEDERSAGTPSSDGGTERSSPDETKKRGLKRHFQDSACPVCGINVRPQDIESHFASEIISLERISKSVTPVDHSPISNSPGPSGISECRQDSRWETLQRIRTNRIGRSRCKSRRRRGDCDDLGERCSAPDSSLCPICSLRIVGSSEDFSTHIVECVRKRTPNDTDEEHLDVDGDPDILENKHWKEKSSISESSFSVASLSQPYRGRCNSRNVQEGLQFSPQSHPSPLQNGTFHASPLQKDEDIDKAPEDSATQTEMVDIPEDLSVSASGSLTQVLTALKSRISELEDDQKEVAKKFKCIVCHNRYMNPLVSTSCWHIHCEECWRKVLEEKAECPQCKTKTETCELRTLFL